ncbi:bone morphogenetic protein 10 [Thalassophryne amazonica]|uniref:bone morphogenetic protein 10 n=1 Tax=Thalassophryne amazonica TaxID=390379 RepID=UPI0014719770|nr:bone morphogenetic protein 10 [Thalassophryne amazonica]
MANILLSKLGNTCSSKTLFLLFSIVLLQRPRCGESKPISNPHQKHRPASELVAGLGEEENLSLLQKDSVDMQGLLDSLKEQFLHTFNLSGLGPASLTPGSTRAEPPEYMMELYNRFASDHSAMPTASIVRSFKNEDSSQSALSVGGERCHPLLFNVSVPHHERITAAELRLYTLIQNDRHFYAGVDRKVTIYEVELYDGHDTMIKTERGDVFMGTVGHRTELVELASRQVFGINNSWEAYDLTTAVQRWSRLGGDTTHRLEVHIASMSNDNSAHSMMEDSGDKAPLQDMKIDTNNQDKHKPLLIVFSNDQSSDHRGDKRELNEMIDHETSNMIYRDNFGLELNGLWGNREDGEDKDEEPDEEALMQMRSNLIYDTASRIRRNARGNHCRKQSLFVEFKDIGWDSWILAPNGYDAFECSGICSFPLTKHVTPTKHAIVQTLVNIHNPQKVARACCVPTKLDPISLLYLDDMGIVTYKYKYEGMVVAECGCR